MVKLVGKYAIWMLVGGLGMVALTAALAAPPKSEPAVINPFGKLPDSSSTEREDAVPGYVVLSNGKVQYGRLYLTRDKRLKIYDDKIERQREIPLNRVKEIDCQMLREWVEKEWRFKEMANAEKVYTGRSYPSREYSFVCTLNDGRKITGSMSGILFLIPGDYGADAVNDQRGAQEEPLRFQFHKRDKGEMNTSLKALVYVKTVKLGEEAFKEGKAKAGSANTSSAGRSN
jgi:hypothetical protein